VIYQIFIEYLSLINNPEILHQEKQDSRYKPLRQILANFQKPVISVQMKHTLGYVISNMNFFQIHRVYLVDNNNKPIGILSVVDVLEILYKWKDIRQSL